MSHLPLAFNKKSCEEGLAGAKEFLQEAGASLDVPLWEAKLDLLGRCPGELPTTRRSPQDS